MIGGQKDFLIEQLLTEISAIKVGTLTVGHPVDIFTTTLIRSARLYGQFSLDKTLTLQAGATVVSRSYHLFGLGQVSQNSVTYKLKCNSPLNGVRHRSLLVFFSLATNVNWFFMSDGCLSLVTVGHVDQRRTLVNALTFQL